MIAVDSSEYRCNSRLPEIESVQECSFLEEETGADIIISPLDLPLPNKQLLKMHVEGGAILVQRKSGRDFVESCYHRSKVSLAKMHAFGAEWKQCWIIATGIFLPNGSNGKVVVGNPAAKDDGSFGFSWTATTIDYTAFASSRRRLLLRCGIVEFLVCDDEIPGWCISMEQDLKYMKDNPVKEVYPEAQKFPPIEFSSAGDPFQELKLIKDQRSVLASFRGVGPKKATSLWEAIFEYNKTQMPLDRGWTKADREPKLIQMLHWASISEKERKLLNLPAVKLWGEKTRKEVAKQLGLQEHEYLTTRRNFDDV